MFSTTGRMLNNHFHNGHYLISEEQRILVNQSLQKVVFDEMLFRQEDGCLCECPFTDASVFLHGACNIFAFALHLMFGYQIFKLVSGNGNPLHWFAIQQYKDKDVYIDVRGATTDKEEFIIEVIDLEKDYRNEKIDSIEECFDSEWKYTSLNFAKHIISESECYYKIGLQ